MEAWLDYAEDHQCLTNAADYSSMYRQLRSFWNQPKPGITPEMLRKRMGEPGLYLSPMWDGNMSWEVQGRHEPMCNFVARKLNSDGGGGKVELWHNWMDEPRVLCPGQLPESISSYAALAAAPQSNAALMRQACGYENSTHSFMQQPGSFDTIQELLPVFSPATIEGCFADLVIQHSVHLRDLPSFDDVSSTESESKREEIFWRGGATGSTLFGLNRTDGCTAWDMARVSPTEESHYLLIHCILI